MDKIGTIGMAAAYSLLACLIGFGILFPTYKLIELMLTGLGG